MIPSDVVNPLILSAFTKEITWLEASSRHPLDEFIDTFFATRARTHETINDLTDAEAAFASPEHTFWSISESITHLIYSQGFYHNKLLDISTSQIPHAVEAARGFGEGAKTNIPVKDLKENLTTATKRIRLVIEGTRRAHNSEKIEFSSSFGQCNYKTWVLLLLAHEVDHLRQMAAMRRLARTNL